MSTGKDVCLYAGNRVGHTRILLKVVFRFSKSSDLKLGSSFLTCPELESKQLEILEQFGRANNAG